MGLWEIYYRLGIELFELGCYGQALEYWVQAYEHGYEREHILEHLYSCYVLPNEQEFKENYEKSKHGVTGAPYEECALDFIPVTDQKYYIFDKEQGEFAGIFELEGEPVKGREEEFHSLLIADLWDIREIIPKIKEKNWNVAYVVLNSIEKKFISFLKLPRFRELYLSNVGIIQTTEQMRRFFEEYHEFYLPKEIFAPEPQKYLAWIQEIHEKRIHGIGRERGKAFLSVCIPSYNRGTVALRNIRHLLQCVYDSEIEIVISNNGSVEDTGGYQEIAAIKDSRLRYHEFDKNRGFAENLLQVLKMASGEYAVITSDEDFMDLENLGKYLSYIKAHPKCGVFRENGCVNSLPQMGAQIHKAGIDAIIAASNLNYMTGITYNMEILRAVKAFEVIEGLKGNIFADYYMQIPIAVIAGKYSDLHHMDLILWHEGTEKPEEAEEFKVMNYALPESRVAQQNAIMDFYRNGLGIEDKDTFIHLWIGRCAKTYLLILLILASEEYRKFYTWEEACLFVYHEHLDYLKSFPMALSEGTEKRLGQYLLEMFLEYLNDDRIMCQYPLEERTKKKALHSIMELELRMEKKVASIMDITEAHVDFLKEYLAEEQKKQREIWASHQSEFHAVETFLKDD